MLFGITTRKFQFSTKHVNAFRYIMDLFGLWIPFCFWSFLKIALLRQWVITSYKQL